MSLTPTPTVSFPLTTAATITTAITSTELDHDSKPDLRADSYFSSLLAHRPFHTGARLPT